MMKGKLGALIFGCLCCSLVLAQSKTYNFLRDSAEMISTLAHPTTEYRSHSISTNESSAYLTIYYFNNISDESHTLKLKLAVGYYGPSYISVISDTAFFPPFAATELIKDLAIEYAREELNENEDMSYAERKILQKILDEATDLSGIELTLLLLQLNWLGY